MWERVSEQATQSLATLDFWIAFLSTRAGCLSRIVFKYAHIFLQIRHCVSRNLVQMGDVSNQKSTCCWSSSWQYLAFGQAACWSTWLTWHDRWRNQGLGTITCWLMCLSSCCSSCTNPAAHCSKYKIYLLSHPWFTLLTSSLLPWSPLTSVWVLKNLTLSETLFRLYRNCVTTIVWLCVTSVNVVWGFERKYIRRSEEEVYENPWFGFKQWLRIVYAGVSCAERYVWKWSA